MWHPELDGGHPADNCFLTAGPHPGSAGFTNTFQLPDLILLDLMMPDMDGLEVCRRLKADPLTQTIPVIFLTASNEMEHLVKGFEVGAVD